MIKVIIYFIIGVVIFIAGGISLSIIRLVVLNPTTYHQSLFWPIIFVILLIVMLVTIFIKSKRE